MIKENSNGNKGDQLLGMIWLLEIKV